jgi:light-regulated signal transduction histidine kinase (bacteriophytochrome)
MLSTYLRLAAGNRVLGQVSEKFRKAVKRLAGCDRVTIYQFRHKEREDDE